MSTTPPSLSLFSKFSISPPLAVTSFLSPTSPEPEQSNPARLTLPLVSPAQSTKALISHLDAIAPVIAPQTTSITLLSQLLQDHHAKKLDQSAGSGSDFTSALRDAASLLRAPLKLFSTGTYLSPTTVEILKDNTTDTTAVLQPTTADNDADSAYWSQGDEEKSASKEIDSDPIPQRYMRDIRANPDHLRMIVAEMNMMRSRKIICPLRPRTYLHKRTDHFQYAQTSKLRFEIGNCF
ncbi:hypothetical protein INT43_001919 [Umbelopsis isabellina]|uniref:Uncharacterized protein n=1 Tax=Mortierella isabellina TaxID=91625 RepID=A0A8H7PRD9_MORIS|nr:hypothetical protein INT43_001919 [Umbelopsis isabellina]